MPVYNEESTVLRAIDEVLQTEYPCDFELIVVDDGSTDNTGRMLARVEEDQVIVRRHPVNRGKGAALLTALSAVTGTHILPFDADLEYRAGDIPRMLEPVLSRRCSVVYGTRLFGCNTVYQTYRYALGNRLLTRMANVLFNAYISDLHTCLKLIPSAVMKGICLRERGFGLDTEITAILLKQGIRPFEVPVSYYGRTHGEGKKITWRDAVACARILLQVRFARAAALEPAPSLPGAAWPACPARWSRPDDVRVLAGDGQGTYLKRLPPPADPVPVCLRTGAGGDSREGAR